MKNPKQKPCDVIDFKVFTISNNGVKKGCNEVVGVFGRHYINKDKWK